jgi:protein-arginine kinase activator protein McsA
MSEQSITCPKCGMTSHHPQDVLEKYCGNCHQFHSDMLDEVDPVVMIRTQFTQSGKVEKHEIRASDIRKEAK